MKKNSLLTKILAVTGTMLVWLPVLAPIIFTLIRISRGGPLMIDWLMPAELFPAVLLGGGLILWAALRAHLQVKLTAWSLGLAIGMLVGGQCLAVVSGLASGETEADGLWWGLVLTSLLIYTLAVISIGIGGILLIKNLYSKKS